MVDVYIFWVLGGFFSGVGVGTYGPKYFDKFYDRKYDGGGVGCVLQYGRIIISLILYIPCVGFCVGIIIIEMFSSVIR